MIRNIKKHDLDFERTFSYFVDHIKWGNALSQKISEKIDFHHGIFFTLLPDNADLERLYEFLYGGIIPSIPYAEDCAIEADQGNFIPQHVITMNHELGEFIAVQKKSLEIAP